MKALRTLLLLISATISCSALADLTPYAGGDIQWHTGDRKKINKNTFLAHPPVQNIFAGLRFNENFGMEVGIHGVSTSKDKNSVFKRTRKTIGHHLTAIGYIPFDKLNLIGGVGVVHTRHKHELLGMRLKTLYKIVPRGMVGLEYKLFNYVKLRTTAFYESNLYFKRNYNLKPAYGITGGIVIGL